MSHITGTVVQLATPVTIGPDSEDPPSAPNTWVHELTPAAPSIGITKFVLLHFRDASFPSGSRLEVDLGYLTEKDVFTSADGTDFWTRPVNVAALPGGRVTIRYITSGGATGGIVLDKYGRGEQHAGEPGHPSLSNSDPFLLDATYAEPVYDPFWFCSPPPNWENVASIAPADDIRKTVAQSVGMMVAAEISDFSGEEIVSTCSVTLVGPDIVLTAGHCLGNPEEDAKSTSVIFNYQVESSGARPPGYVGRFHKVKKVLRHRWPSGGDFCLMQIKVPPGGLGIPPIEMRSDLPALGEQVYGIHHPNGAVKKLSIPHPGFDTVAGSSASAVNVHPVFHVSGGSSGSGLFDMSGRVVGTLSNGEPCRTPPTLLSYFPTASILDQLETPAGPALTRDVMIVFDRSGSMSMDAGTGRTKMVEAQDAASLFVQLVRTGNRLGLVSFSTGVSDPLDHSLANVDAANKLALIGPSPFTGGKIGDLMSGGNTTIGGGLKAAGGELPATAANPRAILLLTDGLQNTPPMIEDADVQNAMAGVDVHAIGFGTEASLDGALLTQVTEAHNGLYTRAGDGLALKKFFSLAFGNIFEAGALIDPEFDLPRDQRMSKPISFNVCGEEIITVVVGWDNSDARLFPQVNTPNGVPITGVTPGIEQSNGRTWTFLRIPLPHGGERDGVWRITVTRPGGGGEFPPPAPALRYFINVIASGGPKLARIPAPKRYYTGDTINPMVMLGYDKGGGVHGAKVRATVSRPDTALGNILSRAKLGQPVTRDGDTIPARQARLLALEAESRKPVVGYKRTTFDLISDPAHTGGAFKPHGLFGNSLKNLLDVEGNYTFHVVASYGKDCISTRELQWSVHVHPGIDPSRTNVTVTETGKRPDGTVTGTMTVIPRDIYGNSIGPGRVNDMNLSGTTVAGPVKDNGDGSYTVPVAWDPAAGAPSLVVSQPGRPPVVIGTTKTADKRCKYCWLLVWLLLLLLVALGLLVLWLLR